MLHNNICHYHVCSAPTCNIPAPLSALPPLAPEGIYFAMHLPPSHLGAGLWHSPPARSVSPANIATEGAILGLSDGKEPYSLGDIKWERTRHYWGYEMGKNQTLLGISNGKEPNAPRRCQTDKLETWRCLTGIPNAYKKSCRSTGAQHSVRQGFQLASSPRGKRG